MLYFSNLTDEEVTIIPILTLNKSNHLLDINVKSWHTIWFKTFQNKFIKAGSLWKYVRMKASIIAGAVFPFY